MFSFHCALDIHIRGAFDAEQMVAGNIIQQLKNSQKHFHVFDLQKGDITGFVSVFDMIKRGFFSEGCWVDLGCGWRE